MDTTTTATATTSGSTADPTTSHLTVTEKAVEMIKEAMVRENLTGHGVRVGVVGGGCSGFGYSMDFENAEREGDHLLDEKGVKLYIDPMSYMYLEGATIDYVVGPQGAGFKFTNPNARNTCGCGQSFSY